MYPWEQLMLAALPLRKSLTIRTTNRSLSLTPEPPMIQGAPVGTSSGQWLSHIQFPFNSFVCSSGCPSAFQTLTLSTGQDRYPLSSPVKKCSSWDQSLESRQVTSCNRGSVCHWPYNGPATSHASQSWCSGKACLLELELLVLSTPWPFRL